MQTRSCDTLQKYLGTFTTQIWANVRFTQKKFGKYPIFLAIRNNTQNFYWISILPKSETWVKYFLTQNFYKYPNVTLGSNLTQNNFLGKTLKNPRKWGKIVVKYFY